MQNNEELIERIDKKKFEKIFDSKAMILIKPEKNAFVIIHGLVIHRFKFILLCISFSIIGVMLSYTSPGDKNLFPMMFYGFLFTFLTLSALGIIRSLIVLNQYMGAYDEKFLILPDTISAMSSNKKEWLCFERSKLNFVRRKKIFGVNNLFFNKPPNALKNTNRVHFLATLSLDLEALEADAYVLAISESLSDVLLNGMNVTET